MIVRRTVQTICAFFGILFAVFACVSGYLAIQAVLKSAIIQALIYFTFVIISGSLAAAVYHILVRYSQAAVESVAGFCGLTTAGAIISWIKPPLLGMAHGTEALREIAILLLPFLAGWVVYRIFREVLFRLTIERDD